MQKTWKIGEYCQGGIITIEIKNKMISVIGKEWDSKKEFTRRTFPSENSTSYYYIQDFLNELTTYFYAEKVLNWIDSKVQLKKDLIW